MNKRVLKVAVALGLVVALAGCGGGSKDTGAKGGSGKEAVVKLESTAFNPKTLEVGVGTTVKWVNNDPVDHSIFEGEPEGQPAFKSADMGQGKEFTHTFDKPGTYKIYCNTASHHLLGMKMEVVVK